MIALQTVISRFVTSSVGGPSQVGTTLNSADLRLVAGGLPKGTWGSAGAPVEMASVGGSSDLPKGTW
jgi:hypothetical protein